MMTEKQERQKNFTKQKKEKEKIKVPRKKTEEKSGKNQG